MPRLLLLPLLALFVLPVARAVELDWTHARWACPSTVKMGKKTHRLIAYGLSDGPPANIVFLKAMPYPAPQHIRLKNRDIYLECRYKGLDDSPLLIHAEGATYCGYREKPAFQAACWTTPYNRRLSPDVHFRDDSPDSPFY
jgi:hypothetical protein